MQGPVSHYPPLNTCSYIEYSRIFTQFSKRFLITVFTQLQCLEMEYLDINLAKHLSLFCSMLFTSFLLAFF
jgi:hypothetical protein